MSQLENSVHGLVQRMFPFNIAVGWSYKGFTFGRDDGRNVVHLRFEKKIMGRMGFCVLHVFTETLNVQGFDLKQWVIDRLREEEGALLLRHRSEFAGAA